MRIFLTVILLLSSYISCYSQEKVELNDSLNGVGYKIPKNDFVVFNLENKEGLYTGKIDFVKLKEDADFAICCMGRIPPISVVFFDKGYQSGFIQIGSTQFASESKPVIIKSDTSYNLGDYEAKRNQILSTPNTYIIEETTIGYDKFFYVLLSDVDDPKEERFYSKLTDMTKKLYKGENADYYFQGFEHFEDKETYSGYVDFNGNSIFKLKFYFSDFSDILEIDQVFTKKDCKSIFGRDYVLKTYSYVRNEEYVLTWYEF